MMERDDTISAGIFDELEFSSYRFCVFENDVRPVSEGRDVLLETVSESSVDIGFSKVFLLCVVGQYFILFIVVPLSS